jgi:DNA-binding Lrp family transcriptional regulator
MMLTDATSHVDAPSAAPGGLWLSISALAEARGVSKQVVSKNLKRWAAAGAQVSMRRQGKALLVNVAEYDRAHGELTDLAREQGAQTKRALTEPAAGEDPVFAREQARKAAYDADLAMIKRDEQLGRLVPVAELERAAIACGEAAVRTIDQIVNRAEELAEAVAKSGVGGARTALKEIARDLRRRLADEFARLPTAAMVPQAPEDNP